MSELWATKIYTPSGFVKENIFGGKKALDVGCGQRKLPGAVGMDVIRDSKADVIHDISDIPWPFEPNSYDVVLINQTLEHVDDIPKTLEEIHRVSINHARVIIQVPYFRSVDAYADPTHKHFFTYHTLDYFVEGSGFSNYKYSSSKFKKIGFWYGWPHRSKNPVKQLLKIFIHRYPDFYDQYLSLIFPVECLTWELEVIK